MSVIQFPKVPIPPKLTDFADTGTGRVYYDCNVAPIPRKYRPWLGWKQATPDSELEAIQGVPTVDMHGNYPFVLRSDHEVYAGLCGLTPTLQIYNQTANQATMWSTNGVPDILPMPPPCNWHSYVQANGNSGSDYMASADPVLQEAKLYESLRALATLTHNDDPAGVPYVTRYGGFPNEQYMPIIFDFESSKTFNGNGQGLGTFLNPADHLARAKRWRNMLEFLRQLVGYSRQIFVYEYRGLPIGAYSFASQNPALWDAIIDEENRVARLLSGYCQCGYMSDVEIRSPQFWYQGVINADREIDEHYPQWRQSKIMYINPYFQPSTTASPYYAKLMPMALWETQIKFLVARGWSMMLWIGDQSKVASYQFSAVKPYPCTNHIFQFFTDFNAAS